MKDVHEGRKARERLEMQQSPTIIKNKNDGSEERNSSRTNN